MSGPYFRSRLFCGRVLRRTAVVLSAVSIVALSTALPAHAVAAITSSSVVGTHTSGVNPDTFSCAQPTYLDFESYPDGYNLSASPISGLQFSASGGNTWLATDFATGRYNGKYPNGDYTSQGTHEAWMGPNEGAGRIDFVNGPAANFSLLVSDYTPVEVDAYDAANNLLAIAGPASYNLDTGTMDLLSLSAGSPSIAYVIVHDSGNYFAVDSFCTDAPPYSVPGPPLNATASPGASSAAVSWSPPTNPGTTPVSSYTVTSSPGGNTCTTPSTSCVVPGLTVGTLYTFRVTAANAAGTGPASAPSNAVTPYTVPGAPTSVVASPGDTQAVVYWTAPADDGGASITSYTATAAPGGQSCSTAATFCTVTGLSNGTAYTFQVTASNAAGSGGPSGPSPAVTPAGYPSAPTGVSLIAGAGTIGVSWSAASGNGSAVTSYTATASPGGQSCATETLSCTITGLTVGAAYTVTVTATNGVGTGPASDAAGPITVEGVPDAPTSVTAIGGDTQATVSWLAPLANGSPITSYTVTAADGTTPANGGQTCTTATLSCTVTGLDPGDSYTFTVTATNAVGTGPASDPSNAVTPNGTPPSIAAGPTTAFIVGTSLSSTSMTASAPVTVSWTGVPGSTPICSFSLQRSVNGGAFTAVALGSATATTYADALSAKTTYQYRVQANGCDGLTSGFVNGPAFGNSLHQENDPLVTYSSTPAWTRAACATCSGGFQSTSTLAGATATIKPNGAYTAAVVLSTGPNDGQAQIKIDGVATGTIDTHSATAGTLVYAIATSVYGSFGPHTIQITNLGTSGHPNIQVDAFSVLAGAQPHAPAPVIAVGGDGQASVSWTPGFAGGSPITSYTVTSDPSGLTCTTATTSCIVTGLVDGTTYTFTVQATNSYGPGQVSLPSNAVTPAGVPSAPGSVTAVAGRKRAVVSWAQPNSNGSPIISYTATASPGGAKCTTINTTCTVLGLTNGTTYTFTVTAKNSLGTGPPSAPSNAVVPVGPPFAPTGIAATAGDTIIGVSWIASDPNGTPVLSYTATASPGGQNCTTASVSCTITGLTNGTSYTVTVTATNAAGTSNPSAPSNAVVPVGLPFTPVGVSAAAGDTLAGVSWTAPNANGAPITSYTVTSDPGAVTCVSATTNCTVTGLVDGVTYTFTVTATNAVGTGPESAPSNAVTPDGAPPVITNGPTVVLATGGSLADTTPTSRVKVAVSWTVQAGIAPVCSEQAQVSITGGHSWKNITLGSPTATSVLASMTAGTPTEFRVRATGCDAVPSAWSTTGNLTASILQENSSHISYNNGWSPAACAGCSGGSQMQTALGHATATINLTGVQSAALVLSRGPNNGKATVSPDHLAATTVNTHAATTQHLKFAYVDNWGTDGNHRLVLKNLATSLDPSLQLDAVVTIH